MKTKITFITLLTGLLLAGLTMGVSAEDRPKERKIVLGQSHKTGSIRPNAPSRQEICCSLDEYGMLTINFAIPEGEADLTISSEEEYITDTFDTSAIYVTSLPETTSSYSITILTEEGNTYSGQL